MHARLACRLGALQARGAARRGGACRTWSKIPSGLEDLEGTLSDESRIWMVSPTVALAWAKENWAVPRMYRSVRRRLPRNACRQPHCTNTQAARGWHAAAPLMILLWVSPQRRYAIGDIAWQESPLPVGATNAIAVRLLDVTVAPE